MEDTNDLTVDDVTVEELSEYSGAATFGTAGSASSVGSPVGSSACAGTSGSF